MKSIAVIVLYSLCFSVFGQEVKMIPNKRSSTREFYQNSEGTYSGSKAHLVRAYHIPKVYSDSLYDSIVMYKIGKDLGVQDEAVYTVGCYELSFYNQMDSFEIVDSMYLIPFYYTNISSRLQGHNPETVIKVFTSEKKRKKWLRNKMSLFVSRQTDENDISALNYYVAKDDIWEKSYIHFPITYKTNKPIYVYIVVQNPTDRILVRFR